MIVANFTLCFVVTAASVRVAGQSISCCLIKAAAAQIIQQDFSPSWSAAMEGGWERERERERVSGLSCNRVQTPTSSTTTPAHTHTHTHRSQLTQCLINLTAVYLTKDRHVNLYVIHFSLTRLILAVWTAAAAQSGSAVVSGLHDVMWWVMWPRDVNKE